MTDWIPDPETIGGCIGIIAQFGTDDPLTYDQDVETKLIVRIIQKLREHHDIATLSRSSENRNG